MRRRAAGRAARGDSGVHDRGGCGEGDDETGADDIWGPRTQQRAGARPEPRRKPTGDDAARDPGDEPDDTYDTSPRWPGLPLDDDVKVQADGARVTLS
jgi:hypothetical protein